MIVGHQDFVVCVDAYAYGVVGDALASDLTNKVAIVVEDLDAVGSVVADVNLLALQARWAAHAIGEFEVFGAVEFLEDVAMRSKIRTRMT